MITRISLLVVVLLFSSCTDFWSSATKRSFRDACMEGVNNWAGSEERANTYCDCVLRKMMERYPNEQDAFRHLGELATDTGLINCREVTLSK